MSDLDETDLKILDMLQADALLTDVAIADKVNLERSAVTKRRLKLEKEKYIVRYQAVLDRKKLGLKLLVHTLVQLENHRPETLAAFEKQIEDHFPNIIQWFLVQGSWEYLLTFIVRDIDHYDEIYQLLTALPDVNRTRSHTPQRMRDVTKLIPLLPQAIG